MVLLFAANDLLLESHPVHLVYNILLHNRRFVGLYNIVQPYHVLVSIFHVRHNAHPDPVDHNLVLGGFLTNLYMFSQVDYTQLVLVLVALVGMDSSNDHLVFEMVVRILDHFVVLG